ncbi:glycosyl hydrolase family 18 protein [Granulicella sp. S190]|uniref:glycosyl hydrolase family 18 protein n=1 Tax=Granulicella sp. S190 TaxID=1747226 RepID=UPI00131AD94A|nr:glycosyl hydrolase family 18 protein [Granulicella sp. S190]
MHALPSRHLLLNPRDPADHSTQPSRRASSSRFFFLLFVALFASLTSLQAQTVYESNASSNALEGTAVAESCSGCLNGFRVGNIGNGNANYLRIKNISVPTTGTYTVTLYYTEGTDGGARSFTIQVNDGAGPTLNNLTGSSWTAPAAPVTFQANFTAGSTNSIGFFNASGSAPDVDHIVVSAPSGGGTPTKIVAPYVNMGNGYPYNNLPAMASAAGLKYVTLAFIIADYSACEAAWDDYSPITSDSTYAGYLQTLRNAGGDGIISFGGAAGYELADKCTTQSSLQAQYQAVITKYNATRIDFDIENNYADTIDNEATVDLRNKTIAALQAANPGLIVSFTIPVDTTGLDPNALYVLTSAQKYGVKLSTVNIMTMDYDDSSEEEGSIAVNSATGTLAQLKQIGSSSTLGITSQVGYQDPNPDGYVEIFSLADAQKVATFANSTPNVSLLSFWALERDQKCPSGETGSQNLCSGVSQSSYQFSNIFEQF